MTSVGQLAQARNRTVDEILVACRAANVIAWSAHAPLDDDEVAKVDAVLSAPPPPPLSPTGYAPIGGPGVVNRSLPPPPPGAMLPPPPPGAGASRGSSGSRGSSSLKVVLPVLGAAAFFGLRVGINVLGTSAAEDRARDRIAEVADAGFDDDVDEELGWQALATGDCFDNHGADDDPNAAARLDEVDCAGPHDAEVYVVGTMTLPAGADFPDEVEMGNQIVQACGASFERFVGIPYASSTLDVITITPLESTWNVLDQRTIVCAVVNRDGTQLPGGSAAGSGR